MNQHQTAAAIARSPGGGCGLCRSHIHAEEWVKLCKLITFTAETPFSLMYIILEWLKNPKLLYYEIIDALPLLQRFLEGERWSDQSRCADHLVLRYFLLVQSSADGGIDFTIFYTADNNTKKYETRDILFFLRHLKFLNINSGKFQLVFMTEVSSDEPRIKTFLPATIPMLGNTIPKKQTITTKITYHKKYLPVKK